VSRRLENSRQVGQMDSDATAPRDGGDRFWQRLPAKNQPLFDHQKDFPMNLLAIHDLVLACDQVRARSVAPIATNKN